MSWKKIALLIVLADFVGYTAYVVAQAGYSSFSDVLLGSIAGIQVFADLVISLGLICLWMSRDAREHGISPIPYLVVTLFLGSIGPLLYLLRRPEPAVAAEPQLARAH